MLQKYYTNTIQGKFIKELLRSTYIPTVPVYKLGDSLIQGMTYISGGYIVKAKQNTTNGFPSSLTDSTYFEILEPYVLGKQYRGITSNFVSNSSTYDSETHKQLGDYLRTIRDLYNINLMPFYNCFSGDYSDNIRIDTEENKIKYSQQVINDGYKVMLVPIKFNQTYTIYLSSSLPITLGCIYYDNQYVLLNETRYVDINLKQYNYASMDQPIYYRLDKTGSTEAGNDPNANIINNYLTLLIQVPSAYSTNVVVLEGEYKPLSYIDIKTIPDQSNNEKPQPNAVTQKLCEMIVNFENESSWTNQDIERLFPVEPFLTHTVGTQNYAFSSRLIEYLLQNVITDKDYISDDIERVQQYCSSNRSLELNEIKYNEGYIKGVWDIHLQKYIYDLVTTKYKKPYIFDVTGFVDKDSEQIVNRGKTVGGNEKWQN